MGKQLRRKDLRNQESSRDSVKVFWNVYGIDKRPKGVFPEFGMVEAFKDRLSKVREESACGVKGPEPVSVVLKEVWREGSCLEQTSPKS